MSDIVERLRACSPLTIALAHEAIDEIERLRKELSETALTALSIDSRAMELQLLCDRQATWLAEAVEVMRSCRAAYVENDDASALDIIVSALERYINKYEGRS